MESMKRKSGDRTVTVAEFHRECLRTAKLPLGKVVSGRGARVRRGGRKAPSVRTGKMLWDRLRIQ